MRTTTKGFVFRALSIIGLTSTFASMSLAAAVNVADLNKQLAKDGQWTAKDNWVTELPADARKHLLGLKGPVHPDVFVLKQGTGINPRTGLAMPATLDWRSNNGQNYVSPILNQGQCGSCVAFATVATFETQLNISNSIPGLNIRLSPQNLFACGGGGCQFGWDPNSAANYLQSSGIPDEACMPYTSGATGQDVDCSASCADTSNRLFKIQSFSTPSSGGADPDSVKAALQNGPLVTTLNVYADFEAYSTGVYKHTSGALEGGHAISIVGYDDTKNAWIARNSWGEDWGDHGFIYVDYSDVSGVSDSTWSYSVAPGTANIGLESPRDYDYFSTSVATTSTFAPNKFSAFTYNITDSKGKLVASATTKGLTDQPQINTTSVADGKYFAQVVGLDASGNPLDHSTPKMFFVLNSKPTISISFAGTSGTDLTQPLSGVITVAITSHSDPVPMNAMELHLVWPDGTDKVSDLGVPSDSMQVQIDTGRRPNGKYDMYYVGKIVMKDGTASTVESAHTAITISN